MPKFLPHILFIGPHVLHLYIIPRNVALSCHTFSLPLSPYLVINILYNFVCALINILVMNTWLPITWISALLYQGLFMHNMHGNKNSILFFEYVNISMIGRIYTSHNSKHMGFIVYKRNNNTCNKLNLYTCNSVDLWV